MSSKFHAVEYTLYGSNFIPQCILTICIFLISTTSFCQQNKFNVQENLTQYQLKNWTTDEGLPTNSILNVLQDNQGFLWIASFDGLIKFDGLTFEIFNSDNTKNIHSDHVSILLSDTENNIWIGTGAGLVLFKNGNFHDVSQQTYRFIISSMFYDKDTNTLLIGTREKGLYVYDITNNKYERIENKLFDDTSISAVSKGIDSALWVGTEKNGLLVRKNDIWTNHTTINNKIISGIYSLSVIESDEIFIGTTSGLFIMKDDQFQEILGLEGHQVNKVFKGNNEDIHILTSTGIYELKKEGNVYSITKLNEIPDNHYTDYYLDNEGNSWFTTYRKGLFQLKESPFINYTTKNGLSSDLTSIIYQYDDDTYLVGGTNGGISILNKDGGKTLPVSTTINRRIYDFLKDSRDNLWIATYQGLLRIYPDGSERLYAKESSSIPTNLLRTIFQDSRDNIWIGTRTDGLIKLTLDTASNNPLFEIFQKVEQQLNSNFIMSIDEDNQGNLVIGTNGKGINIKDPSGKFRYIDKKSGLISDVVFNTYIDDSNILWVATRGGLSRIEKTKVFNYASIAQIPNRSPFDIIEDDLGYFWLPSSTGIIRVEKKQLNQYHAGVIDHINWRQYDKNDGLVTSECTGATKSLLDNNGKLFFPTFGGVVSIDPENITFKNDVPPTIISKLLIDDEEQELKDVLKITSDKQRLVFTYTSPSLSNAKKIRFKYQLVNFDRQWINAGSERQAIYTNLSSGNYEFKVIASNEDGVWGTKPDILYFKVLPFYYETWWFYTLCFLIGSVLAYGYYSWKTVTIKKRSLQLENKVNTRTQQLEKKSLENEILYELSSNLIAPIELDSILKSIMEGAVAVIPNAQTGSILLLNSTGNMLEGKISFGIADEQIKKVKIKVGEGQTGKAVAEKRSFIENNLKEDYIIKHHILDEYSKPIKSIIVVLLMGNEQIIGTITLDNFEQFGAFSEKDMEILTSLAANASVAIERVKMYHQIDSAKNKLNVAYTKLKELDKYKEAMTAMIIHDFKNSLNTVIGYSEAMPDERRIKSINQAGKFMLNMVMNILDVQKFDEATIELSLSNEPISFVISEAIDQVKYMIEQKSITLTIDNIAEVLTRIDIELIIRVFVNMLSNAIKFSPHNEKIIITVEIENDTIKTTIIDHGPGIPTNKLDMVFEKYSQINAKKSGNVRSTGIGLTFCKLAIEAHNGTVGVSSKEGQGAAFWFTLPVLSSKYSSKKMDNATENLLPNPKTLILSVTSSTLLKPYINELQQWEVYDYSEVMEIIERINIENNQEITAWLNAIKKAIQHVNEVEYSNLVNI